MSQKYIKLNDIDAYRFSYHLSNFVWKIILKWEWFPKKTIGTQYVTAMDSISANIAEGFGRYHKKDRIKFYRYSQGSIKECYDWNEKSMKRNLISKEEYKHIFQELQKIEPALGSLIKYTNDKLKF